jgi:predicted small integral membrane protein
MIRVICLFLLTLLFGMARVSFAGAAPVDSNVQNNQYYLESVRLLGLARECFDYGDYDAAAAYAAEALKYAMMSDDYVAQQLKMRETNDAIAGAKERIDWATSIGAKAQFPTPYNRANSAYNDAVKAQTAGNWNNALDGANKVLAAVAEIETLQAKEANDAVAAAKERIDWATSIGAKANFPTPYNQATAAYNDAVKARTAKKWTDAISAANKALAAVAEIEAVKTKEASDILAAAKERLDWATDIGAKTQFPTPYNQANSSYNDAVKARTAKNWDDTIGAANKTIAAVAEIEALAAKAATDTLATAKERLDWATSIGAKTQFPDPYNRADSSYNDAVKAQNVKKTDDVITAANKTIAAVAEIEALKTKAAADALAAAKERLDWATAIEAKTQFPNPYNRADSAYTDAVKAQNAKKTDDVITAAGTVLAAVAEIEALKTKEAGDALAAAKERLDWAGSIGAKTQFSAPYNQANSSYNDAVKARTAKNWDDAIGAANKTIAAVAEIEALATKAANDTLATAKERLDWATTIGAKTQFPNPYNRADSSYNDAVKAQNAQKPGEVITAANKTIAAVAEIEALATKAANDTLATAKERLDWATTIGAKTQFPNPYNRAVSSYNDAVKAQNAKKPDEVITASNKTIAAVAEIEALKAKEATGAITAAKERLDRARAIGADTLFPDAYNKAGAAYNEALTAQAQKNWDDAIAAASRVLVMIAEIENLKAQQDVAAAAAAEAERLRVQEVAAAIAAAKERLDWATGIGAKTQFPDPYNRADSAYNTAVKAQGAKTWDNAMSAAGTVLAAVAEIEALKAQEAANAIAAAKERLDGARSIGVDTLFPDAYNKAEAAYNEAVAAQAQKNWDDAIAAASRVVVMIAEIENLKAQQDAAVAAAAAAAERLRAQEVAAAIAAAKERLDWATGIGAKTQFSDPYNRADSAYNAAVKAQGAKTWDNAMSAAGTVLAAVAEIEALKAQEAANAIAAAKERLDGARSIRMDTLFPDAYNKAGAAYNEALAAQAQKNWDDAIAAAGRVLVMIAEIERLKAQQDAAAAIAEAQRLLAQEVAATLARAKEQLDWAASIGADTQFPTAYNQAGTAYNDALEAQAQKNWNDAIAAAERVAAAVAEIERLQLKEAQDALTAAKERLDWAASVAAAINFPGAFTEAQDAYHEAERALAVNDWAAVLINANKVLASLASVHEIFPLPAQYLVRTWEAVRDCLWNIAGYPWVYNDPTLWRRLYDANRSKLPNIDNPDFILPEVILDIPSIRGEQREGIWDEYRLYEPLP